MDRFYEVDAPHLRLVPSPKKKLSRTFIALVIVGLLGLAYVASAADVRSPAIARHVSEQADSTARLQRYQTLALLDGVPVATMSVGQVPASLPSVAPPVDASAMSAAFSAAVQSHNYELAIAAGLMLLVFAAGKLGLLGALNPKLVPWVSVGLSVVGAVCTGLLAHQALSVALGAGFEAGLAAVGMWEAAGQHFFTFGSNSKSS
jgi:hypothetical protein